MLLNFTRKVGETKKDAAIDVQRQENNLSIFQSFVVGCYTDFFEGLFGMVGTYFLRAPVFQGTHQDDTSD